jgi:predicted GNAT family N-acyltransferase
MSVSNNQGLVSLLSPSIDVKEIADFLAACDADFSPPISQRTDLKAYAEKLIAKGRLAGVRKKEELIGLAAFYCNDQESKRAYVTYLAVKQEARGSGLGAALMLEVIRISKDAGMETMELQTDQEHLVRFYKRLGFEVTDSYTRFGGFPAFRLRRSLK